MKTPVTKPQKGRLRRGRPAIQEPTPETEAWIREHQPCSYWEATRRPFPSLLFVAPMAIGYEVAVLVLEGEGRVGLRSGADAWMRQGLASAGLSDPWFLPLILGLILMGWQLARSHDWRFSPPILGGMIAESLIWAIALLGIGRLIDLGFTFLDHAQIPALAAGVAEPAKTGWGHPYLIAMIGYIGAGVYEETLFRLMMVPAFYRILRILQAPQVLASSWAVVVSALLFAMAHHTGTPGEPFTWYVFVFRWMAGVFFAWVFVLRGFGIAVGTHTVYDVLVGWIG